MSKRYLLPIFLLIWLHSHAQTPDWVWARSAQSYYNGIGEGLSIAVDTSSNVFIAGWYIDTISFGSYQLISNSPTYSSYITKYDAYGNVLWLKGNTYTNNNCIANSVCVD